MKLQKTRLTILGLWLGAMAFFSFVVAPSAFAVLQQQQLAGALVSRTLGALEIIGIIAGAKPDVERLTALIERMREESKGAE